MLGCATTLPEASCLSTLSFYYFYAVRQDLELPIKGCESSVFIIFML